MTLDPLTDDSYIDTTLDATTGYAEATLMHLLDERELMLAAFNARTTIWRND
jgi:hypothetical protein